MRCINLRRAKNFISSQFEWPTWLFIGLVYSVFFWLLFNFNQFPLFVSFALLTITLTAHSSLCHELIHGHPTQNQSINNLIGYPPITLIYPYTIFKETHIKHHENKFITYPDVDPESFFITKSEWKRKSFIGKRIAWFNMTLLGRLLLGPSHSIGSLAKMAIEDIFYAEFKRKMIWICHYMLCALIVFYVNHTFNIHPIIYLASAYFSLSLIQMRSFYEHQPDKTIAHRSVIQEACWLMSLLYLNNNYHYVHHQNPGMPWYQLRKEYFNNKEKYTRENGSFVYSGYINWLRFLVKPINSPIHPFRDT